MLLGWLIQRLTTFAEQIRQHMTTTVLWACIPSVALLNIPHMTLNPQNLVPALMAWLIFTGAVLWSLLWQKYWKLDHKTTTCLILTTGLGNTSFVGLPMVQALFGSAGLPTALMLDQAGTFFILSTWGLWLTLRASQSKPSTLLILKRLFKFPPFLAFGLGLALLFTHQQLPNFLSPLAEALADCLMPLALMTVGLQLKSASEPLPIKWMIAGLSYKLILAPLLILLTCLWLRPPTLIAQVSVVESAMGPMITAAVLATQYRLNPALASRMVSWGIPLSLVTLLGWFGLAKLLFN